ncbi:reverse transcriptase domain-containing protein [Tanacetum coccineum]
MDSQIISLNEELQDIRNKYNELREENASNNDDTPMCERHEANYIQSEELNKDVRNDLEDFKRCVRSMRTVHWKNFARDDGKITGVLPNKKSKIVNQEPQSKTDFEKSITKFLDGQRVTNMFFKNNVNDMILKMRQNERNFQTIFKNMEIKIDEWEKSQNLSLKQTNRTDPPPPQAHIEHVNFIFTRSGKSDDHPKIQKDPPPSIIVNNKAEKGKPIKTSKGNYHAVKTEEYPFDVEPKQIILDPDDQPMSENAKIVAPTPNSAIVQPNVDDNFVINSTHLKMILENKFNGYMRADLHDHIREFLAICNMFRYSETQSEAVKLLIFPFSLCDEAKTWFNELNEKSITSWEQMRKAFINKLFPPSLFNRLLLEIRNFSTHEPTQGILDVTDGGIFLYKSPNQAFQFLEDKVLFEHDWPIKSKNEHHQKSVSFANGSDSNTDNSRFIEKLKAMDSQFISLKEELQDIGNKYNELREENASTNHMSAPMCEHHEANYIQYKDNKDQNSHDSHSYQSHYDPNDSLTEINKDVRNDLEDFERCVHSMRTVHWKLFARDDGKTTSVLPNKVSKPIDQEPQSITDFEKLMTNFLDDQRVSNMFVKNNINDMILKMKQNEKNFQTIFKNMEIKIDEWEKSQNLSLEQTNRTDPPPPQAHIDHVNVIFIGSGKSDDHPKIQKDPPPSIINIGVGIKLYEWAGNLVAPELVLDHHLLDRSEHSLLVLRSPMYPKSKKNVLDEEEVLCQP